MEPHQAVARLLLDEGEKIHVAARRTFEGDIRRHFVGVVTRVSQTAARAEGYTFIFDGFTGQFTRRPDVRTRIVSLMDANLVIEMIPKGVDLARIRYKLSQERRLVMTDEDKYSVDIHEYHFRQG